MWNFWIDVGGTFTDCIGISPDGRLQQFKTLSSGRCKGAVRAIGPRTLEDELRTADPDDFWTGIRCRLLDAGGREIARAVVERFHAAAGTLQLDQDLPVEAERYELTPQWPAPVLGIRWLLRLPAHTSCPPVRVRFGTTRGTNALLTRTGARTALITTRGLRDVPLIGNQDRPRLFELNIRKPSALFEQVFEVAERTAADGSIVEPMEPATIASELQAAGLTIDHFDSVAICLLNAYQNPEHEQHCMAAVRQIGFREVSCSHEVSPLIRFVPRCDTTVLDAYLNPVLRDYLNQIADHLPGSHMQVMTSAGGLIDRSRFRGRDCILSGPAGGIVGFSSVAQEEGFAQAIGFDMGGTSTDVARFAGSFQYENETQKAGVRIMTPTLAIETVAAGGGSICGFDGTRLFVGPDSAGADPGPACYGTGGPLTVTDLNVYLGRVYPGHFPFPLNLNAIEDRLTQLREQMIRGGAASRHDSPASLAEGLLQIANDNMAQAIRKVSVAKGFAPADHALISFGGAGGQHACSIARQLGIRDVLVHPLAGILSAFGMGRADVRAIRQTSILRPLDADTRRTIHPVADRLQQQNEDEIRQQGIPIDRITSQLSLELRYTGTGSSLRVAVQPHASLQEEFETAHRRLFGYIRPERPIEVVMVQVETVGRNPQQTFEPQTSERSSARPPNTATRIFDHGRWHSAQIVYRDDLQPDRTLSGPCLICEPTSTIFLDHASQAVVTPSGCLRIRVADTSPNPQSGPATAASADAGADVAPLPATSSEAVQLEVFNNQFVSIAEQMGETLRRTSTSTNVRERLDFSCAVFDSDGRLVVNAPHVPVHLGAMGETVRAIRADHPSMQRGDVFVTNDPFRGGSHLPDVTVVTPVFATTASPQPDFFVANRAHHAEIGGIVPGSMPPFSKTLAEEGVLIRSRKLVDAGRSREAELDELLSTGAWPSRSVADNLADLNAQVAANEAGARLLTNLTDQHSTDTVQHFMRQVQATSALKMKLCLEELPDGTRTFEDQLDDGHRLCVTVTIDGAAAVIDFTGSADVHPGNLNANRAITTAAVLYSLRCLLAQDVPLNDGVLQPISLVIPPGLLNPPAGVTPESSPAMVGGNVETSQRIVDVVLGAFRLAAASQGTMNNLTFGNDRFGYYETICGGAGATPVADGADAVHTHMTNTRLTDPEILERRYPVRLNQFGIRPDSGGAGQRRGGHGIVREIQFLETLHVAMLSQRRSVAPWGLAGGSHGKPGMNLFRRKDGSGWQQLPGCFSITAQPGDTLRIKTPGGGGYGPLSDTD